MQFIETSKKLNMVWPPNTQDIPQHPLLWKAMAHYIVKTKRLLN